MRLASAFGRRRPSIEHRDGSRRREVTTPVGAAQAHPGAGADAVEPSTAAEVTPAPRRPAIPAVSAARLDELRTQAQFARERYHLYKAKVYGPHLTSPTRLRELERESARTAANLSFAKSESAREAEPAPEAGTAREAEAAPEAGAAREAGAPHEDQTRVRTGTG